MILIIRFCISGFRAYLKIDICHNDRAKPECRWGNEFLNALWEDAEEFAGMRNGL